MKQWLKNGIVTGLVCLMGMAGMPSAGSAQEQVTLKFWHTMNEKESLTLNKIIEAFQQANPQITVQTEFVPFGDARNKFEIAAQTGTAPDVFRAQSSWIPGYVDAEYLLALDEYLSAEDRADYVSSMLGYNQIDDQTYGLPQVVDALALVYNKRLLKEAGHDNPPATLSELEQVVADVKSKLNIEGFYMRGDSYWFLNFLWAFGGGLVDAERKIYVNNDASVEALAYLVAQKDRLFPGDIDFANDYNDAMVLFKEGKVAMILQGPWATADMLSGKEFQDPANLGVAPFPKGPRGDQGSPIASHSYVMSANSAHPDEAYRFAAFLNQANHQALFAAENNLLPTRISASNLPEVKENAIIQGFLAQLQVAKYQDVIPEMSALYSDLTLNLRAAWRGEKTPKQAMDDVAAAWQAILE